MIHKLHIFISVIAFVLLSSCSQFDTKEQVITVSFTPWIGFFPMYYAIENQIDRRHNVELRVIETMSVLDFRRANIKKHVDAFAMSVMELTRSNMILSDELDVVVFMDYSNGADVIIANNSVASLEDLSGKSIGFEWRALGHYFVNLAFESRGIQNPTYVHRNVDQVEAPEFFMDGSLDAYATFPPISSNLLKKDNLHVIFDSSEIPYQILDLMVIKKGDGKKKQKLRAIWRDVMDYIESNPEEYIDFLANMLKLEKSQVQFELAGIEMINGRKQKELSFEGVSKLLTEACNISGDEALVCFNSLEKLYFDGKPLNIGTFSQQ